MPTPGVEPKSNQPAMNVLIVYAHPEPKSFNAALRDIAVSRLKQLGHSVQVSDLYEASFNPVAGPGDYAERANPEQYEYRTEMKHALKGTGYVSEIEGEQEKL